MTYAHLSILPRYLDGTGNYGEQLWSGTGRSLGEGEYRRIHTRRNLVEGKNPHGGADDRPRRDPGRGGASSARASTLLVRGESDHPSEPGDGER